MARSQFLMWLLGLVGAVFLLDFVLTVFPIASGMMFADAPDPNGQGHMVGITYSQTETIVRFAIPTVLIAASLWINYNRRSHANLL